MLEVVPITLKEANAFVEQNHRHHGPTVQQSTGKSAGAGLPGVRPAVVSYHAPCNLGGGHGPVSDMGI